MITRMDRAVFRGLGDVAVVPWVVSVSDDYLYVTDDKGIADQNQTGHSDRIVGMAKERAYRYDPAMVTHGAECECYWTHLHAWLV